MNMKGLESTARIVECALAILFVCAVNAAVPFLLTPTLGQAIWTLGYAQSFANAGLLSVHASEFGIPEPAAIAFGLAGAWPASLLLRIGLAPEDAYAAVVSCWLIIAVLSARQIALRFGSGQTIATLGAVLWGSFPVIWAHSGYSMLSMGIALLPYYFLALLRLAQPASVDNRWHFALSYILAALISVFMDGYSFMMFATGASLLLLFMFIAFPQIRLDLASRVLPVHALAFALAYSLYTHYVGTSGFERSPLEFFRGWGVDVSFTAVPTRGLLWVTDWLGLGGERSVKVFYGDDSTWETTFTLPMLLAVVLVGLCVRLRARMALGFLLVALFAFYFSLGPSLKVHSTKPSQAAESSLDQGALMRPERAVMATGSAWVSEHLPGFNAMRAPYRWTALWLFSLWMLLMLSMPQARGRWWPFALLATLIALNLPHPREVWLEGRGNHTAFRDIDNRLVAALAQVVQPHEVVAFAPWGNDFFANYLAPRVGFRTYNVGGDKGVMEAIEHWPLDFLELGPSLSAVPAENVESMARLLARGQADVLIVPYFNLLRAAHIWPCLEQTAMYVPPRSQAYIRSLPRFLCPNAMQESTAGLVAQLREKPYLQVDEGPLFASIRLAPRYRSDGEKVGLLAGLLQSVRFPIYFQPGVAQGRQLLVSGWYSIEPGHVWSRSKAALDLPEPSQCSAKCGFRLRTNVFAATAQRAVTVSYTSVCSSEPWTKTLEYTTAEDQPVVIPSCPGQPVLRVFISVQGAASPRSLSIGTDNRILGVDLKGVESVTLD